MVLNFTTYYWKPLLIHLTFFTELYGTWNVNNLYIHLIRQDSLHCSELFNIVHGRLDEVRRFYYLNYRYKYFLFNFLVFNLESCAYFKFFYKLFLLLFFFFETCWVFQLSDARYSYVFQCKSLLRPPDVINRKQKHNIIYGTRPVFVIKTWKKCGYPCTRCNNRPSKTSHSAIVYIILLLFSRPHLYRYT